MDQVRILTLDGNGNGNGNGNGYGDGYGYGDGDGDGLNIGLLTSAFAGDIREHVMLLVLHPLISRP